MLQEETIRRLERERKGLNEKISVLDSSLAQAEGERRQLRDKVTQLQQSESKSDQEKEAMRAQIENAESRMTKVELRKRSLEGKNFKLFKFSPWNFPLEVTKMVKNIKFYLESSNCECLSNYLWKSVGHNILKQDTMICSLILKIIS